jgi:hypothetical protein
MCLRDLFGWSGLFPFRERGFFAPVLAILSYRFREWAEVPVLRARLLDERSKGVSEIRVMLRRAEAAPSATVPDIVIGVVDEKASAIE